MSEFTKQYLGGWISESPKAGEFIKSSKTVTGTYGKNEKGFIKPTESDSTYNLMLFKSKNDSSTRNLTIRIDDDFKELDTLVLTESEYGAYFKGTKVDVVKNRFYEEGSRQPKYNFIIKVDIFESEQPSPVDEIPF